MAYQGQKPGHTGANRPTTGSGRTQSQFQNIHTPEVQALSDCMTTCKACAKICIEEGHAKTAAICNDCSEVCDLALKCKCCNSEFTNQLFDLCGQVCKRCADECSKAHTSHCQECGEICKQCAEACSHVHSYR